MKYYAISTTGNVADLAGSHKDLSAAWDHAECGPWEIAGVFTEDEIKAICDQLNVRFHDRPILKLSDRRQYEDGEVI